MSKAYLAYDRVRYDEEGQQTIVFAETANKAKQIALCTEACEYACYTDIRVKRYPEADKLYCGSGEIDWSDMKTRFVLVKDFGWACYWKSTECDICPAKQWCRHWETEVQNDEPRKD